MYETEYIPYMQAYRIYKKDDYLRTVAYENTLEEAIKRWDEEEKRK